MTKIMSVILAILMAFSCVVFASAETTAPEAGGSVTETNLAVPKPELDLDVENKIIIVKAIDPIVANGTSYPVDFSINPTAVKALHENGKDTIFVNLTMGKKYTVTATITVDGTKISSSSDITLKNSQNAPDIKAAKAVTSTSIEVSSVAGGEYKIEGPGVENTAWGAATKFTDLNPDTLYTVSIRFKETESKYASAETKITVRTLKSAKPGKPEKPVLENVDMNSFTLKETSGVQYSLDLVNWQDSNKFTGLKAGETYSVYARYAFDEFEQEAGAHSDVLIVKLNTRAAIPAKLEDCKISIEKKDTYYANENFKVTVEVKQTYITHKAEYGDTVYVPTTYQIDDGAKIEIRKIQGAKYEASVAPGTENANKTIKLAINFTKMKYVGGDKWIDIGEETSSIHKLEIGPENNSFNKFVEAITGALNFLLNDAPAALANFLKSDIISGFFEFFLGLGGGLGDINLGGMLGGLVGQ